MASSIKSVDGFIRTAGSCRFPARWPLALSVLLAFGSQAVAQDRTEIVNKSNQSWTLALVEGGRPGTGSLKVVDKFTGKAMATLTQVGDTAVLPPQGHALLIFNRYGGYLFRDFILKDNHGYYAEYVASLEFLSSKKISIQLVDQHVGPPMDHADDGAVKQFISDGIELGSENIIIHVNSLGETQTEAQRATNSQKFDMKSLSTF